MTFLNTIKCIDPNILDLNNAQLTQLLFYGQKNLDNMNNTSILLATIKYLIETKRFDAHSFLCSVDIMTLTLILLLFLLLSFFIFSFFCSQLYQNIYMYTL